MLPLHWYARAVSLAEAVVAVATAPKSNATFHSVDAIADVRMQGVGAVSRALARRLHYSVRSRWATVKVPLCA